MQDFLPAPDGFVYRSITTELDCNQRGLSIIQIRNGASTSHSLRNVKLLGKMARFC
ncbi:hypothetical protein HMPREF1862_00979 [Varibaculum cambriense]|uniref:Uncharacterized protein n=1 Tax=Varibaculum cambriense TaxID=184870 RepID=A0AB34WZJ4_9ACTO|nr:hypothetical protein HMPREF1862_00979 [Varibaculum cambriense]